MNVPSEQPSEDRMEDLPVHPRILAEQAEQERLAQARQKRAAAAANRGRLSGKMVERASPAQTQTHLPQMSTAQRRRNQVGQPREGNGKYAEKPPSKWRAFLSHEPPPKTNLKKVPWPHPTGERGGRARTATQAKSVAKKKTRALPSVQKMVDRPLHEKVGLALFVGIGHLVPVIIRFLMKL